jgi:ABC-type branched-subunit amino acid transport system substrate-binding protein
MINRLSSRRLLPALLGIGLLAVGQSVLAAEPLTPAEARGKRIYSEGVSAQGSEVVAYVGAESVMLPASATPCAGCHGPDGLGRPEGGVIPPDIRWSQLTKSYGHVHTNGRRHPPFDEESFAAVVKKGHDPAGNRLDETMPLYTMSVADMDDLIAYMKRLETDYDPGVEKDSLQVATLLPLNGPQGKLGQAMAQMLHGYFKDLNDAGGVFGRKVDLLIIPFGDTPQATLGNLQKAVNEVGVFALVGPYTIGLDQEIQGFLRSNKIPLVGPFTLNPGDEFSNESAFFIYPGFAEQARVLADKALADLKQRKLPLVVAGPKSVAVDGLIEAVIDQSRKGEGSMPLEVRYPAGEVDVDALLKALEESGGDEIIFFGAQAELDQLLSKLSEMKQTPRIYMISAQVSRSVFESPAEFNDRLYVAHPTLPGDISKEGRFEYGLLSERHALPHDHIQGQLAALAAAKLFVEGLKQVGREVYRVHLIDKLEELYAFDTGVTPPLSYGPNRRIGARGAHVVGVDLIKKNYRTLDGWKEVR